MPSIQQVESTLYPEPRNQGIRPGDKVRVHVVIEESGAEAGSKDKGAADKMKSRIQVFEGTVIAIHRAAHKSTITVRKVSYGVGVERIFPIYSPNVPKIEIKSSHRVRRSKLYYLRGRRGKSARLKTLL
jgi:large subunit ribosomal protein L19